MNGESFYVIVVGLGLVDKPKSEILHVVQNDKKEKHPGAQRRDATHSEVCLCAEGDNPLRN
jgi:hypothetical protein